MSNLEAYLHNRKLDIYDPDYELKQAQIAKNEANPAYCKLVRQGTEEAEEVMAKLGDRLSRNMLKACGLKLKERTK